MPETFPIEKNVPMPLTVGQNFGETKYPFAEMEVGDSFALIKSLETVRQAARNWSLSTGSSFRFSLRKTPDGFRCWRVA